MPPDSDFGIFLVGLAIAGIGLVLLLSALVGKIGRIPWLGDMFGEAAPLSSRGRQVVGLLGVVVIVGGMVFALIGLIGRGPGPIPPPPTAAPATAPPRTEAPTASPGEERAEVEQALMDSIFWVNGCQSWALSEAEFNPFEQGATGAILCEDPRSDVDYIALYRLPDSRSLNAYYRFRKAEVDPPLPSDQDSCRSGNRGEIAWTHGSMFCYVGERGVAIVRWTDDRTDTYGILNATNQDIASLYRAWTGLRPRG